MSNERKAYYRAYQQAIRDAARYVQHSNPELWGAILEDAQRQHNVHVNNYKPRTYDEKGNNE